MFPVHPRTRPQLERAGLAPLASRLTPVDPLGYLDFLSLTSHARLVLTDSGGIQEETTVLGIPCLTLRRNTERPVTIDQGTNQLVGVETADIRAGIGRALGGGVAARCPALWDGHAGERIAAVLRRAVGR